MKKCNSVSEILASLQQMVPASCY